MFDLCPVCGKDKPISNKTCSYKCSGTLSRKIDWDRVDLQKMLNEHKSYTKVGDILGVTGSAVRKRAKTIGIT